MTNSDNLVTQQGTVIKIYFSDNDSDCDSQMLSEYSSESFSYDKQPEASLKFIEDTGDDELKQIEILHNKLLSLQQCYNQIKSITDENTYNKRVLMLKKQLKYFNFDTTLINYCLNLLNKYKEDKLHINIEKEDDYIMNYCSANNIHLTHFKSNISITKRILQCAKRIKYI